MAPNYQPLSWIDTFRYLYKNKIAIFGISFSIAVLVAAYSLFIPNKYTSTANLLPSQRPSIGFDLFSEDGGLSSLASSVLGTEASAESNRYIVLLSSYSTSKKVIEKFDLISVYELNDSETQLTDAINELNDATTFESQEEGNFIISVETESPELSKKMADYYIEILNEENTRIVSRDAKQYRGFIEKRYNQVIADTDSLQNEVIAFQKKHGVFELTTQAQQYFTLIGSLTAKEVEAEIRLQLLSETVQKTSDAYKTAETELKSIQGALNRFYNDSDSANIILNFGSLSEVGAQYFRMQLEIEIQAEITKFLRPLYEQAKMEEAKTLPIVSVVDAPIEPEIKSYPKRSLIVISSGISAFILVLIYFILRFNFISNKEYFNYLRS